MLDNISAIILLPQAEALSQFETRSGSEALYTNLVFQQLPEFLTFM